MYVSVYCTCITLSDPTQLTIHSFTHYIPHVNSKSYSDVILFVCVALLHICHIVL